MATWERMQRSNRHFSAWRIYNRSLLRPAWHRLDRSLVRRSSRHHHSLSTRVVYLCRLQRWLGRAMMVFHGRHRRDKRICAVRLNLLRRPQPSLRLLAVTSPGRPRRLNLPTRTIGGFTSACPVTQMTTNRTQGPLRSVFILGRPTVLLLGD